MRIALVVTVMVATAGLLFAGPVHFTSDDTPATLIELFTSEGCSSCPPADAWISQLKTSPDLWKRVVPVVFHVDYWNGLGWPDRFASRDFTARQRSYAAAWRSSSVYTPGFVINGREWRGWFQREALPAAPFGKVGKLVLTVRDGRAEVVFTRSSAVSSPPLVVEVALLGGGLVSDVKRGENSGRKLQHDFVVLHHTTASLRAEGVRFIATVPLPSKTSDTPKAIAAWITAGEALPPIQAVGGWLK